MMNKKFMLAAVMGCTMALGFSGCSDDDENENGGKCSQQYILEFLNTEDTTDCQYIESAYQKVTNSTSVENRQIVTLEGKDSLTCLSQFKKLMEQAESQLSGKNFQTNTCVYGYTSGQDSIYGKVYGTVENYTYRTEVEHFYKGRNSYVGVAGEGISGYSPLHCVKLGIEWNVESDDIKGYTKYFSCDRDPAWAYLQSMDINNGTSVLNLYIHAYLYNAQSASNPGDITDVRILDNGTSSDHPSTLTYDGRTYTVDSHNLNDGMGGNCLYICYTRDYYDNQYLTGNQYICYRHKYLWKDWILHDWLDISKEDVQSTMDQFTAEGYIPQIVPMIYWGGNSYTTEWGEAPLHYGSNKGHDLMWIVCYRKY